ncbi:unnamed protein product [Closterium sp. NIES-54]
MPSKALIHARPDLQLQRPDLTSQHPDLPSQRPDRLSSRSDLQLQRPYLLLPRPDLLLPHPDLLLPRPDLLLPRPDLLLPHPDLHISLPDLHSAHPDLPSARPDLHSAWPDLPSARPDLHFPHPDLLLPRSDLPQGCLPRPYPQQHHQRHLQRHQQQHPSPCLPHNIALPPPPLLLHLPPPSPPPFLLPSYQQHDQQRHQQQDQQQHQQQDQQRHQQQDQQRYQQQDPRPILLLPLFPPTLVSMASSDSSIDLATVDALELLPDNTAANWHSYAHSVEVLLSSVVISNYNLRSVVFQEGGGLQPSSETAIRTYRTNLQEHLRQQLRYDDEKRIYDDAAARYSKYQEDLDTYTADLADYTMKITAWRVADRRALAILLATIPSSLKRELSPTSSSHQWRLLVDLFNRQDVATLYALIKEFSTLSMDSTSGATAFTRRVLDLARRLAALDVVYPDTVICCHLLEGLTPAFDAHKLAYMQLLSKHHTPAEVAHRAAAGVGVAVGVGVGVVVGVGVDEVDHWVAVAVVAVVRVAVRQLPFLPQQLQHLQQQLQHLQQQLDLQPQLPLLPPPPVSQQQPFPTWTAGSAAFAAHLSGASPAPSGGGNATTFPSSGFVSLLGQPESVASPMYPSSVNETSFQYSASPSSTLDFVLDSGATDTVFRDAGTLRPLPTPTSLLGADSSFSLPCHNTSTLPCPLFPSGTVTGLHIPSLRTNLLSQRSL